MHDKSSIKAGHMVRRSPKALAAFVFFSIFLVLFRISLISMIKINSVTVMHYDFHCRAMELLHLTFVLLSVKESRNI